MLTVFILVEHGWRYNDEYYRHQGYQTIEPVCYSSREQAEKVCEELNEKMRNYYSEEDTFYDPDSDEDDLTKDQIEFYEVMPVQLNDVKITC